MPNELPIIVSNFIFGVIFAILTQAALAFIGLGDPTLLTWGNMLSLAYDNQALSVGAWWWLSEDGKHLIRRGIGKAADGKSKDALEKKLSEVNRVFQEGRAGARAFAEESLSWGGKWALVKSTIGIGEGDAHKQFLAEALLLSALGGLAGSPR